MDDEAKPPENKEKSPPDTIVYGLQGLAQHFGKSERQVRRWVKAGCPILSGRRFDVIQVQAWIDGRQGLRPEGRSKGEADARQPGLPSQDGGKDYWDKKAKEFQAKQRELDYRKRLGELIERTEVEQLFVDRIMAVKQGLLSLARGLPPQLIHCQDERAMEAVIAREVRALLESYSRPLPQHFGGAGESESGGSGTSA